MIIRTALCLALAVAAPAVAAPGDVARSDFITIQDGEFRKMDADKNGQLTRPEVEDFQRLAAVATAQARNRQWFAELDSDRNGQLSPAEFAKVSPPVPIADGRPLIAQFDLNKDGQISLVENRAGKLAAFDRIDTDKDGVVTAAEMRAAGVVQ